MGELQKPVEGDLNFRTWRSKNSLVTAWLLNSMKPFIVKPNMFLPIAQDVWDSENPNDCARRMKREENDQVYMFLAGVSRNLDEIFSKVRQEECRKRIMFSNPELTLKLNLKKEIGEKNPGVITARNYGTLGRLVGRFMGSHNT
ncbi:hypothetical protein AAG906_024548 [Vitis piasezkii]